MLTCRLLITSNDIIDAEQLKKLFERWFAVIPSKNVNSLNIFFLSADLLLFCRCIFCHYRIRALKNWRETVRNLRRLMRITLTWRLSITTLKRQLACCIRLSNRPTRHQNGFLSHGCTDLPMTFIWPSCVLQVTSDVLQMTLIKCTPKQVHPVGVTCPCWLSNIVTWPSDCLALMWPLNENCWPHTKTVSLTSSERVGVALPYWPAVIWNRPSDDLQVTLKSRNNC